MISARIEQINLIIIYSVCSVKNRKIDGGSRIAFTFASPKQSTLVFLYNFFIQLYLFAVRITALWNKKARQWVEGRKNLFEELKTKITQNDRIIWMHCASAGELEQGKPLVEQLKKIYPSYKILVSFFSPSGFIVAKKYTQADIITYLPADTKKNARKFIELVNPQLVIFIKYEFWYHHLSAIAFRHIPLLSVSAIFRKEQAFFKWYGRFYRQMLFLFRYIFVQDEASLELLKKNSINHCNISGDTRFDRVKEIAANFSSLPVVDFFINGKKTIIAGSTWQNDEEHIAGALKNFSSCKLIIAPHEINEAHLASLEQLFPGSFLYSTIEPLLQTKEDGNVVWATIKNQQTIDLQSRLVNVQTLIIDNIGMLSRLYYYATITYVGGGFNKSGIHNTLEAAVYGKPVLFGPNYQKFKEARDLVTAGAAFSITSAEELKIKLNDFFNDSQQVQNAGNAAKNYVEKNTGATNKIIQFIQENRLLTN